MHELHNKKTFSRVGTIAIFLLIFLTTAAFSQPAEIPFHMETHPLYSGLFDGQKYAKEQATLVFSQVLEVSNAPWLRLYFSDANLGLSSYLIITSLKDRAWQRLSAKALEQWQFTSAYFNGDAVRIDLYVARVDKGVFLQIDEVMVGDWVNGALIESQCGPTDDRIPSNDPRAGRIVPIGCTGWIISNGALASAGHCMTSSAQILEFNVPVSLPGGTIQHPGPEDQYAINSGSMIFTNGGVGNDWGVYEVFNNPVTGLHPIIAQGDAYTVVQNLGPDSLRITGYGVDTGTANQTQQTHVGPNANSSGTTMRYVTDTEGGNSGSPIIDEATNTSVGVHTHGGCTAGGGNNNGTSTFHTAFWNAINAGGLLLPNSPEEFTAYSDYTTPTSILLNWTDPTSLVIGDTLLPGDFTIQIERDGVFIDSVDGGTGQYIDQDLLDGQEYVYEIYARLNSSQLPSPSVQTSWIAGGSPIPNPPANFSVSGDQNQVDLSWVNPSANIDGTPMDDLAGINLYQNGQLVETFIRATSDTGNVESETYSPATPGFYDWHITAVDNESPENESDPTAPLGTPLSVPISDSFDEAGDPNPGIWINSNAQVNDRADTPPSPPYALNLNGHPNGEDIVDLKPLNLNGMAGSGVVFTYSYQPQGSGNAPEPNDSLRVYFKNDLGDWILVKSYPGSPNQPFAEETIDIETAPNGGGSYFHGQFQVRFRSTGSAGTFPNDDWFVDDILLDSPVGIGEETVLPVQFAVSPNYPNPFNPATTIEYQLPQRSEVSLVVYNTLGQKVRTLLNQSLEAGYHKAVWDGRSESGQQVASGIYIYRFRAGDYSQIRKMILLK